MAEVVDGNGRHPGQLDHGASSGPNKEGSGKPEKKDPLRGEPWGHGGPGSLGHHRGIGADPHSGKTSSGPANSSGHGGMGSLGHKRGPLAGTYGGPLSRSYDQMTPEQKARAWRETQQIVDAQEQQQAKVNPDYKGDPYYNAKEKMIEVINSVRKDMFGNPTPDAFGDGWEHFSRHYNSIHPEMINHAVGANLAIRTTTSFFGGYGPFSPAPAPMSISPAPAAPGLATRRIGVRVRFFGFLLQ